MIKKISILFLALLILISTGGIMLYQHHCHGDEVEISINKVPDNCCGPACHECRNESVFIKITDAFTVSQYHLQNPEFYFEVALIHLIGYTELTSFQIRSFTEYISSSLFKRTDHPSFLCLFKL